MSKYGFVVGFILTIGGAGGVDTATNSLSLCLSTAIALVGALMMYVNRDSQ